MSRAKNNFTHEVIKQRAYEIWVSRGKKEGTDAEADWYAAIKSLELEHSKLGRIRTIAGMALSSFYRLPITLLNPFKNREDRVFALDILKTVISSLSLAGTVLAGISLWVTYKSNNERLITDLYSKSVEQLGDTNLPVRLGGIYNLERISKDSKKDYTNIMEILTTFLREKSKTEIFFETTKLGYPVSVCKQVTETSKEDQEMLPQAKAVIRVIARRNSPFNKNDREPRLNLQSINLSKVNLSPPEYPVNLEGKQAELSAYLLKNNLSTNLSKVYLSKTNLKEADLSYANLSESIMIQTYLSGAVLSGANLSDSILRKACLEKANLSGADLSEANLKEADLSEANLKEADLSGADLSEANLKGAENLKPEQVKTAKNWEKAHYNPQFRKQLVLPPE